MTNRVSNKQILEAIAGQTDAITALVNVLAGTQAQPAAPAPTPVVSDTETKSAYKVKPAYLSNRKVAAQAHANKVGGEIVLYARQNLAGRTVLAYAQASRHADIQVRDKGYLGKVATFQPE
jgi:hypothetical protein